MAAADSV